MLSPEASHKDKIIVKIECLSTHSDIRRTKGATRKDDSTAPILPFSSNKFLPKLFDIHLHIVFVSLL